MKSESRAFRVAIYIITGVLAAALITADVILCVRHAAAQRVEPGTWVELTPDGTMAADGSPVTTYIRVGTSPNTMVLFCGGGISFNQYTAARPYSAVEIPDGFYSDNGSAVLDNILGCGILGDDEENAVGDWSIIIIPYSTADYHIGTGDYAYTTLDGEEAVLHHHGYTNFEAIMEAAMRYIPDTEKLLIAGYSAGGFGAAMLADELIGTWFPEVQSVTLCIDSALTVSQDWLSIARDVWQAPDDIVSGIQSDNLVVDFLGALYEKYGSDIQYLYVNSVDDGELARYQNYIINGDFSSSSEQTVPFEHLLAGMVTDLRAAVPTVGIYLYDDLPYTFSRDQLGLTQHTILTTKSLYWPLTDNTSVMQWLSAGIDGDAESHGLEELDGIME